jgi:hypothetical protein
VDKLAIGDLGLHPWDYGRYTLRQLFYRIESLAKRNEAKSRRMTDELRGQWNRTRWLATLVANIAGAKFKTVYQLARFSWDEPDPGPAADEDWLNKFPKTIEGASKHSKT